MSETLTIADLIFELRRSRRRRTVGITVDRGGELIVQAPEGVSVAQIERVVRSRLAWVYGKLALKESLSPTRRAWEIVSGETIHYLGRGYRLKLVPAQDVPLKLYQGRFLLRRDQQAQGEVHIVRWLTVHGQPWIERRVALLAERIGVAPAGVRVRDLGHRWGSCSRNGVVNFHWRVAQLPPRVVEYIVAHELVHLVEPHHTPAFWERLRRAMPDYPTRKAWLATHGAEV